MKRGANRHPPWGLEHHLLVVRAGQARVPVADGALAEGAEGAAGEEDHALLLAVVEEVVERPQAAVLAERVRGEVGVVAGKEIRFDYWSQSWFKHHGHFSWDCELQVLVKGI